MRKTALATEPPTHGFAHGVWEALAVTLAEPLRKAFVEHLDTHKCGDGPPGFAYCPEAMKLWRLLPAGDTILLA